MLILPYAACGATTTSHGHKMRPCRGLEGWTHTLCLTVAERRRERRTQRSTADGPTDRAQAMPMRDGGAGA
jgi:hypothetical protein